MPRDVRTADRADLTWHNGAPALQLQTPDGVWWTRPLTPAQTAALVKRLAGYLAAYHTDPHVDRTADTYNANPDLAKIQQEATA